MITEERRIHQRRPLRLVVNVESASQLSARPAVAKDASVTGILLGCSRKLQIGEAVKLTVQLPGDPLRQLTAKVVRCERNRDAEISLWRYLTAVRFDAPAPELFQAIGRSQAGSVLS